MDVVYARKIGIPVSMSELKAVAVHRGLVNELYLYIV